MLKIKNDEFIIELYNKYLEGSDDKEINKWWQSVTNPDDNSNVLNEIQLKNLRNDYQMAIQMKRAQKAEEVLSWFAENPEFPQPSKGMVFKFLWSSKDDVEKCKNSIVKYFTIRGTDDEIFGKRDTCSKESLEVHEYSLFACMPFLTDELYRINISMLRDYDPEKFNPVEWVRRIFYVSDLRINGGDFCLGDILIYDLKGFTMQHLAKFNIALARKMIGVAQGALPSKLKQIHYVNCPPFADKINAFFKPFLKDKISHRIFAYTDNLDEMHKMIPPELLPAELGGKLSSLSLYNEKWLQLLKENRSKFLEEEKFIKRIFYENKMNGKLFADCGDLFGMEGSFKKLDID